MEDAILHQRSLKVVFFLKIKYTIKIEYNTVLYIIFKK